MDKTAADLPVDFRRRRRALGLALVLVIVVIGVAYVRSNADDPAEQLRQAEYAFQRENFPLALRLSKAILANNANDPQAALLAGRSAAQLADYDQAVPFLERVSPAEANAFVAARITLGEISLVQRQSLAEAERQFLRAWEVAPLDPIANEQLAFINGLTGRYLEQATHRLRLIALDRCSAVHLYSLALGDEALENADVIHEFRREQSTDALPYVTLARLADESQDYPRARALLLQAIDLDPDLVVAHLLLGRLVLQQDRPQTFQQWQAALPADADQHPGIWMLRGDYCAAHLSKPEAIRCYAESVRLDPNHSHANYQLGQLLVGRDLVAAAEPFLERARQLREFVNVVKIAYLGEDLPKIREASELAEKLGLIWEAYAWSRFLQVKSPSSSAPRDWAARNAERLTVRCSELPFERCDPRQNPIANFDVDRFPYPKFDVRPSESVAPTVGDAIPAGVQFIDEALSSGLNFRYFNGRRSVENGLEKMYEFAGGGVAVLDFDGDGLSDVYVTQGSRGPSDVDQSEFLDRLFRNTGHGQFIDVTAQAGLCENGFSQGVAVGDIDNDGWPDLFVANIGKNRLYRNNTDGTFSDVTASAGITGEAWTTSCLIADLNDDGHPDLYAVNYLDDADVFTRVCPEAGGHGMCLPQNFRAAQDRLFLNRGDGRFVDVTDTVGIAVGDGKGLGIIAADFSGDGRLSIFVANDTTPNFLFLNQSNTPSVDAQAFAERAMISGLAMNRDGKTESGMGVAAGDADGDGRLDLFVTNFHAESNTLYQQVATNLFEDVTRTANLREPSLPMVGFGTQFLDADLDGRLDLITTNGHIDDYRGEQEMHYQMPPQYFANLGQGRFRLLPPTTLGPYFEGKYLGRALARIDWNQDGREDVLITHLDAPLALLTNVTPESGHHVTLQLRGVQSNRDAIGATVSAQIAGKTIVRHLIGGDGYLCSNERQVVLGLGAADRVDRLVVTWPSGRRDEFVDVPADSRQIIVEGHGKLLPLPHLFNDK